MQKLEVSHLNPSPIRMLQEHLSACNAHQRGTYSKLMRNTATNCSYVNPSMQQSVNRGHFVGIKARFVCVSVRVCVCACSLWVAQSVSPQAFVTAFTLIMALLCFRVPHKKRWFRWFKVKLAEGSMNREVTRSSDYASRECGRLATGLLQRSYWFFDRGGRCQVVLSKLTVRTITILNYFKFQTYTWTGDFLCLVICPLILFFLCYKLCKMSEPLIELTNFNESIEKQKVSSQTWRGRGKIIERD